MPETTPPPTARRFAPTPVETTSWSSSQARRFPVQPMETSTRSSRMRHNKNVECADEDVEGKIFVLATPPQRFLPEPVETTFKSSRQNASNKLSIPEPTSDIVPDSDVLLERPKPRRKFVPELIETSKRSKRAGDSRPATLPTDKTDLTPGIPNIYTVPRNPRGRPPVMPIPPESASTNDSSTKIVFPPRPRRQCSMRPHCNTRRSTRQTSFAPALDTISSSESPTESHSGPPSRTPSLSGSLGSSEDSQLLHLARTRESCDDRFSGYLLALAAKAAEKQLREQALLAAFPNESRREIVEHFYDCEVERTSDTESVEGIGLLESDDLNTDFDISRGRMVRRKSTEVGWAVKEMQAHQESLARLREDDTNSRTIAEVPKPKIQDPFWVSGVKTKLASAAAEKEMEKMRNAASPPMLGGDLQFRLCLSPKTTKFESDQRVDVQPNRSNSGGGLWGGYCVAEESGELLSSSMKGPPLIQTPMAEEHCGDPFAVAFEKEIPLGSGPIFPKSPINECGIRMLSGVDERLKTEAKKSKADASLLEEFNDQFVTQVYNYLSLGYPSLARQYDAELSRISHIPEDQLRLDDKVSAKGHIGLKLSPSSGDKRVDRSISSQNEKEGEQQDSEKGFRWRALKIYIFEWGRQHPNLDEPALGPSAWGVRGRRGSWAI